MSPPRAIVPGMTGKQAARLVQQIVETGWSRERIAAELGRTTSSLDKWQSGTRPREATAAQLTKIARQRGVPVEA